MKRLLEGLIVTTLLIMMQGAFAAYDGVAGTSDSAPTPPPPAQAIPVGQPTSTMSDTSPTPTTSPTPPAPPPPIVVTPPPAPAPQVVKKHIYSAPQKVQPVTSNVIPVTSARPKMSVVKFHKTATKNVIVKTVTTTKVIGKPKGKSIRVHKTNHRWEDGCSCKPTYHTYHKHVKHKPVRHYYYYPKPKVVIHRVYYYQCKVPAPVRHHYRARRWENNGDIWPPFDGVVP